MLVNHSIIIHGYLRSLFRIIFGRTTKFCDIVACCLWVNAVSSFFLEQLGEGQNRIFHWLGNYIHFVYAGYVLVSA